MIELKNQIRKIIENYKKEIKIYEMEIETETIKSEKQRYVSIINAKLKAISDIEPLLSI